MSTLTLKIVTPEKLVVKESELNSVSIPTEKGEITVLPGHIPLVSKIVPGELSINRKGKKEYIVLTGGFLKLDSKGEILILADYAVRSDELEIAKIEEAKKKAEAAMREKKSEKDFVIAEAELRRTLLELRVAKKRKSPRHN